ncbi:PilZ domain-containing protein [Qipengyuania sp. MTN3-11]|uniref:PilZ domain-containing protein n=1 Tax=Qipengyuania sp. MTN3-11 TaxID=3056557 RepID=UPI0036F2D6C4
MEDRIGRRRKPRYELAVMGEIRTGSGKPLLAEVTDLSETGCACTIRSPWLKRAAIVSVRIGEIGPIESTVCWVDQYHTGLEFHAPIYGPVFDHICTLISDAKQTSDRRARNQVRLSRQSPERLAALAEEIAQTGRPTRL